MDENGIPSGNEIGAALSGGAAFIEKLDQATGGWFAVHKTKRQIKAAEEKMTLSKAALEGVGIQPSEKEMRAIAFSALQDVKGFENLCAVIERVNIPEDAPAGDIEDEWMSRFVECSKEAFSEWKRRVLSDCAQSKATDSSSVSLNALNCISKMETSDMDAFVKVCSLVPDEPAIGLPLILSLDDDLLSLVGLDARKIARLADIGLVRVRTDTLQVRPILMSQVKNAFDLQERMLCDKREDGKRVLKLRFRETVVEYACLSVFIDSIFDRSFKSFFDLGYGEFTEAGRELATFVAPEEVRCIDRYIQDGSDRLERIARRKHKKPFGADREFARAVKKVMKA